MYFYRISLAKGIIKYEKYKIKGHYKIALNQYLYKSKNDISENNILEYKKFNYIFSERLLFVVEIFLILLPVLGVAIGVFF